MCESLGGHVAFGDGEAAVTGFHLDAVIGRCRRAMVKPKAVDSQSAAAARVGVNEYGGITAQGGTDRFGSHLDTLPLSSSESSSRPVTSAKLTLLVRPPPKLLPTRVVIGPRPKGRIMNLCVVRTRFTTVRAAIRTVSLCRRTVNGNLVCSRNRASLFDGCLCGGARLRVAF